MSFIINIIVNITQININWYIYTCSRGGHRNSLVFFAATADGKSDCFISLYLLN